MKIQGLQMSAMTGEVIILSLEGFIPKYLLLLISIVRILIALMLYCFIEPI